jgi:lipoprotein-releasing system permease protein
VNLSSYYAVKFIKRSRLQSLIIVMGLVFGVAVLVVMAWVVGGIGLAADEAYAGGMPHIVIKGAASEIEEYEGLLEAVAVSLPELEAITPVLEFPVELNVPVTGPASAADAAATGLSGPHVEVLGIELDKAGRLYPLGSAMIQGRTFLQGREIVVGVALAEALELSVGEPLVLNDESGRAVIFTVVGIFDLKHEDQNTTRIFTGLSALQTAFGKSDKIQRIELQLSDGLTAQSAVSEIEAIAREKGYGVGTTLEVRSWQQSHSAIYNAAVLERRSVRLLAGAVSLIVLIGYGLVLTLAVRRLHPQLAVFEAMGLGDTSVAVIALLYAFYLSLLGVLGGGIFGSGLVSLYHRLAVVGMDAFRPLPNPATAELVLILTALPFVSAFAAWVSTRRVLDKAAAEVIFHG